MRERVELTFRGEVFELGDDGFWGSSQNPDLRLLITRDVVYAYIGGDMIGCSSHGFGELFRQIQEMSDLMGLEIAFRQIKETKQ